MYVDTDICRQLSRHLTRSAQQMRILQQLRVQMGKKTRESDDGKF